VTQVACPASWRAGATRDESLSYASPLPAAELKNPGLITTPLSVAVALAVAWCWPEPEAEAAYDEVALRIHLGELA
jgi:hypothetical protein